MRSYQSYNQGPQSVVPLFTVNEIHRCLNTANSYIQCGLCTSTESIKTSIIRLNEYVEKELDTELIYITIPI